MLSGSGSIVLPSAALGHASFCGMDGRPDKSGFSGPLVRRRLPRWGRTQRGRAGCGGAARAGAALRRGFSFSFLLTDLIPCARCRLTLLPPSAALVLSPSAACFLASGALRPTSAHDVRDGSGEGRPLQPTPRRRRAEGCGGTGPPRRHGLNTHTGGRVRHRVEGKRLLSIRIVPRVLRSLQLDDPPACVARAFLCLCRPCTS